MQMPMAATFLLVALNDGISRTEVMERLGVAGSTATRNLMGLMPQGRLGRPGHALVEQEINPDERRWRMHSLTPKGRLVLRSMLDLFEGVDGEDGSVDPPRREPRRRGAGRAAEGEIRGCAHGEKDAGTSGEAGGDE